MAKKTFSKTLEKAVRKKEEEEIHSGNLFNAKEKKTFKKHKRQSLCPWDGYISGVHANVVATGLPSI